MTTRRRLLRWLGWFAVVDAALLAVVGLRYLWYYAALAPGSAWVYAALAYVGHVAVLAAAPLLVLVAPVIALLPKPRVVIPLAVLLASAGLSLLVLDSLVFAENRYHLGVVTLSLLEAQTWTFVAIYFLVGLAILAMLASWLWPRTARPPASRLGRMVALGLVGCIVASQLIHWWAEARQDVPVTAFTRYLPLYFPLQDRRLAIKLGLVDRNRARERSLVAALGRGGEGALRYPLAPLRCTPRAPLPSVLLVVIDGMRADALTPESAPRLSELATGATRFDHHYSGGNSSRAGMFSLFYGLPATYWTAFADVARPPVLMDLFRAYAYQFGVFASAPVYRNVVGLDRTALARVPNLRLETSSPYPESSGWDRSLTDEWLAWIERRDPARPFFGFLYYNAVVAIDPPEHEPLPVPVPPNASAQERLHGRYLSAVHFDDALIGRVLDDLGRRKLLDRTVVVVTSDHGMEFDDNGLGFTGHGTSFSDYQMRTPLLIRWPGRAPGRVERRTSHNDLAPTLVGGLFGCANPPADYASGQDLYSGAQWNWLVASSYADFALIEPGRVTVVYPAGYEVRDERYRLMAHPTLPRESLRAAQREMSRFYR
ncbi:MAG TPA: DUF3413 domain-containing protein [Methylomirabilota bacterium]|nr:DUF3413 domain-containing protein [Methylomirabilota bacterium]